MSILLCKARKKFISQFNYLYKEGKKTKSFFRVLRKRFKVSFPEKYNDIKNLFGEMDFPIKNGIRKKVAHTITQLNNRKSP